MYNVHTFCAFLYVRQCAFYMSKTQLSLTSVLAICTNRSLGLQVRHQKMSHAELILTIKMLVSVDLVELSAEGELECHTVGK